MPSKEFMKIAYNSLWMMVIWAMFSTGLELRYGLKIDNIYSWQYWLGSFLIIGSYSVVHAWVLLPNKKDKA